jgi:hypothetical protein
MWSKRMGAFLRGKGQILWDVTVDTGYVQPMDFLAPGSRDRFDANNKAVDYLFRALCQPVSDRVHAEHLACRIWTVLKEAHVGNAQVPPSLVALSAIHSGCWAWPLPCHAFRRPTRCQDPLPSLSPTATPARPLPATEAKGEGHEKILVQQLLLNGWFHEECWSNILCKMLTTFSKTFGLTT